MNTCHTEQPGTSKYSIDLYDTGVSVANAAVKNALFDFLTRHDFPKGPNGGFFLDDVDMTPAQVSELRALTIGVRVTEPEKSYGGASQDPKPSQPEHKIYLLF
jgi:hypothetical protein